MSLNSDVSSLSTHGKLQRANSEDDLAATDFFHQHLQEKSSILRHFQQVCHTYKNDPQVDEFFKKLKVDGKAKPDQVHRWTFYKGMKEINSKVDQFSFNTDKIRCFLDLGAAPGGFSWWILENNPSARGLGITLPTEAGGFSMGFEETDRYKFIYKDVLEEVEKRWSQNKTDEVTEPQFDLCIAGCMFRWAGMMEPSTEEQNVTLTKTRQILRYAQLLTALLNLEENGNLILVSKCKPLLSQVELTCALTLCFEKIYAVKPQSVHGVRSSYYLVGIHYQPKRAQQIKLHDKLRAAIERLKLAETDWIQLEPVILDGSHDEIIEKWTTFVLEHYEPMWKIQSDAMENQLRQNQMRATRAANQTTNHRSSSERRSVFERLSRSTDRRDYWSEHDWRSSDRPSNSIKRPQFQSEQSRDSVDRDSTIAEKRRKQDRLSPNFRRPHHRHH